MKYLVGAAILLSAASPALTQDERVGVFAREWYARLSGTAESSNNPVGSGRVDLDHDLGLGDRSWTPELQAYLRIPVVGRITAGWWHFHETGSEVLSEQIDFAGITFTQSTQVDSAFTVDVAYLDYEFDFPTIPIGDLVKLQLGVALGVRGIRGEASISDSGQTAHDSGTVGLPTLGAHATLILFDMVRVEAEVLGLVFKYSNYEAHYLEAFGEATVSPLPWIFAGVGYKAAQINVQHHGSNSFQVDLDISGFYVTLGFRF
jgi:hypothetical protein